MLPNTGSGKQSTKLLTRGIQHGKTELRLIMEIGIALAKDLIMEIVLTKFALLLCIRQRLHRVIQEHGMRLLKIVVITRLSVK